MTILPALVRPYCYDVLYATKALQWVILVIRNLGAAVTQITHEELYEIRDMMEACIEGHCIQI